jgi:hypothetical protein
MDPLTLMLLGTAAAKAGAGIAQGVGTARAAKKQMLTPREQAELDDLEAARRSGDLGLTERQRTGMEQRFLAEQAGAQRQLQAEGLQQAAARGLSGGVSSREAFLAEQARAGALTGMRQQQNIAVEEANQAAALAQEARIDAMRARQRDAQAMRAQGIAQAVTGGLMGAADVGVQAAGMRQQAEMARIAAEAQAQSAESLLAQYNSQPGFFAQPFSKATAAKPAPRSF